MSDGSSGGHATRVLMQSTVSVGEERTGATAYLLKRHASEGPNRRRFRATLPPELADLEDSELDDRNARVWSVVLADCQRAAGLEPDAFPNLASQSKASRHGPAMRAALQIANESYGIPIARLAELIDRTPQTAGRLVNNKEITPETLELVKQIKQAWAHARGSEHVNEAAEVRQIDVPAHLHDQLATEAKRRGETIGRVIARLLQTSMV